MSRRCNGAHRAGDGLTVVEFTRGTEQLGFPTGSWKRISKDGPFVDSADWFRSWIAVCCNFPLLKLDFFGQGEVRRSRR